MDYFTKWPEAYAVFNQEASTVVESLVTNFCRFGVLHSNQGCNFNSCLMQEVLQRLGVSKTCTIPLYIQSGGMVERYIKMVEEHLRKIVTSHQRGWYARLPILLCLHGIHDTTGLTPANLMFGRELHLPCNLLFGATPNFI
jgi:hypothetical protein